MQHVKTLARVAAALAAGMLVSTASAQLYVNNDPIAIPGTGTAGPASAYPSVINVNGGPDSIDEITVTLYLLSHTYSGDLRIMLVAPNGAHVQLFEAPGSSPFSSNMIMFSSTSNTPFPAVPASGTYRPTGGTFVFPGTGLGPGDPNFDAMIGTDAGGAWRLYIYDVATGDTGNIQYGWSLEFSESSHSIDAFTYQARVDGAQPGDTVSLRFTPWDSILSTAPRDRLHAPVTTSAVVASDGTITVPVDLDIRLPTDRQTYLGIDMALEGQPFSTLSPRQPMNPAPLAVDAIFAAQAERAITADSASSADEATNATLAANSTHLGGIPASSYARQDMSNLFAADQVLVTGNTLAFGSIGNGLGGAENTDLVSMRRVNLNANASELRVNIGDDPGLATDSLSIGYTTSGTNFIELFRFQGNGQALKAGGGSWTAFSDRRLKHNIQPLTGSLDRLMSLRGVSFEYNDPKRAGAGEGTMMGFVAQDVEPIFPRWVSTGTDGYKMLTITGFEALAVEALRDLRAEKDAQIAEKDAQIADLREQIQDLYRRLERLETQSK